MSKLFGQGIYNEKESVLVEKYSLPDFDPENAQVWFDIQIGHPE